jgi:hypothetical protein
MVLTLVLLPLPPLLLPLPVMLALQRREGDWYPAGLAGSDMQGMVGYKIWLSVGLLLGEGAHIMAKAALLGE